MNLQPVEKQSRNTSSLEVHSIFYTIQGEGPYTGSRAVFLRLAGCNLQCPLCDTDYTSERITLTPSQILVKIIALGRPGDLVVITGGEPFRQSLRATVDTLLLAAFKVQIETNGTLYQELPFPKITIVCSPKTGSINKKLAPHIDSLKYVLHSDSVGKDGLPLTALDHPALPQLARPPKGFTGMIYVQPVDEINSHKNWRHLQTAVDSVMKHGYRLQLQVHKIIQMD